MFKILPTARNQSSELRWIFLVAYGKKSLEEIFNKKWPLARNNHRNLDGIYTDFFKVTQKSQKFLSTDHTENTEGLG